MATTFHESGVARFELKRSCVVFVERSQRNVNVSQLRRDLTEACLSLLELFPYRSRRFTGSDVLLTGRGLRGVEARLSGKEGCSNAFREVHRMSKRVAYGGHLRQVCRSISGHSQAVDLMTLRDKQLRELCSHPLNARQLLPAGDDSLFRLAEKIALRRQLGSAAPEQCCFLGEKECSIGDQSVTLSGFFPALVEFGPDVEDLASESGDLVSVWQHRCGTGAKVQQVEPARSVRRDFFQFILAKHEHGLGQVRSLPAALRVNYQVSAAVIRLNVQNNFSSPENGVEKQLPVPDRSRALLGVFSTYGVTKQLQEGGLAGPSRPDDHVKTFAQRYVEPFEEPAGHSDA
jgi:hypothetical protein